VLTNRASFPGMDLSGKVAVGIGGDRLAPQSHPGEIVVERADGTGWSADDIAGVRPERLAENQQTVGQQLPEPPNAKETGA
jgi:phage terminase large subunit-like protein